MRPKISDVFSGKRSPMDELFYSTEVLDELSRPKMVGYVIFETVVAPNHDMLIGDFFQINFYDNYAQDLVGGPDWVSVYFQHR